MSYPPPGWYPDPAGGQGVRWWDGYRWTAHQYLPRPTWPPPAPAAPAWPPTSDAGREPAGGSLAGLAAWGVALWVAVNIVVYGYTLARAGAIHRAFAAYFTAVSNSAHQGATLPTLNSYYRFPPLLYLVQMGGLAATAFIAVWQNRAAHRARWLGYPARYSPLYGAWAWFIPIANLWVPYRALRDCLPPGHQTRQIVLRSYLFWILTPVADMLASVAAVVVARPAFSLLVGVAVAASLVFAAAGMAKVVQAVDRQHRAGRAGGS